MVNKNLRTILLNILIIRAIRLLDVHRSFEISSDRVQLKALTFTILTLTLYGTLIFC